MARTLEQFSPDFLLAVEALTEQLCRSFQENILNLDRKEPGLAWTPKRCLPRRRPAVCF